LNRDDVVMDTNVVIQHRMSTVPGRVSAVVLQELAAGAGDAAEVRRLGSMYEKAKSNGLLLTPDGEDWLHAGKVLNLLLRNVPSRRAGRTHGIDKGEQQRLLRDALIARSARRVNAAVVTYNGGDFEKIRRFCNVRVLHPADVL
jgi:predicted nucleic acid-binding protein